VPYIHPPIPLFLSVRNPFGARRARWQRRGPSASMGVHAAVHDARALTARQPRAASLPEFSHDARRRVCGPVGGSLSRCGKIQA
jgi:hypothetical protein